MTILSLNHVSQFYPIKQASWWHRQSQTLRAVDNISLTIEKGETVAIVGESGCGKSTLGRIAALLEKPTEGTVYLDGVDVATVKGQSLKALRKRLGLVFQDPYSALNPRMSVDELVGEPLAAHSVGDDAYQRSQVLHVLDSVGLGEEVLGRYPHEFSGGQRQRICIARALVLEPSLIIADEPLSALDVSVQSQILNLFVRLQKTRDLAFLFISHDMAVVNYVADTVVVMYLGKVVEKAPRSTFFSTPAHPYSQALLAAVPTLGNPAKSGGRRRRERGLQGDVPSPINPPSGCAFHPRCTRATDLCRVAPPQSTAFLGDEAHYVACHFPGGEPYAEPDIQGEAV
ncbi:ATP-binding cassette domain-containing protein [Enterovibrio sp. ZSDZ35]|uniref:ATP-binding cassette domain-containing protein n=1 Tax=Enterovibrio qingdaonensis TaxID=2899818 RepID=A0ABT5QP95_9GAMM|nr:oligopeptide/dipeptide ABC transporter ATP-binding protein [Enterovibrio sp. ZSDZ35]MDD1782811.1 ATP-binding cassette domain-containing protein [Enterovibrio sp. ZSDZ35]